VTKAENGQFERSLLTQMQTLLNTLSSGERTIHDLKHQLKATGAGRLPAENPKVSDLDPNLYPAFRSLPTYQPTPVNTQGALAFGSPWKQDLATLHDQISGVQKTLLSSELKSDRTREDVQLLRRHIRESGERLAAIVARDERKYIYFDLKKGKVPIQVDDIKLVFKKADPKHHRFTCDLIANNITVRAKNKSFLEPIQIYLPKYARPCEMVVRDISHDEIAGYISVPRR